MIQTAYPIIVPHTDVVVIDLEGHNMFRSGLHTQHILGGLSLLKYRPSQYTG
jgi:hypothetical protein